MIRVSCQSERRPLGEMTRVLVIDDESDIRELIDLTLIRMGLVAVYVGSVAGSAGRMDNGKFSLLL